MITSTQALKISRKTNGHCFYCNGLADEVDHFVSRFWWNEWKLSEPPANYGSPDILENLFPVCWLCNRKKSNKHPEDFIGNPYKAWSRYYRANRRIGLMSDVPREWYC